jgi:receptor protein-tyrosine kinase
MVIAASISGDITPPDRIRVGELLLHLGKLTEFDISRVVSRQKETKLKFGETAERMGLVSREDVAHALARQFDYPCVSTNDTDLSPLLVAAREPFGASAEVIRVLRGHLMLTWFNERRRALAITAPRHSHGTSVIAANLAIAFAQLGERTLLIDANLRRPSLHSLFGIRAAEGLSYLLTGRYEFKPLLRAVEPFKTLAVLCAGIPPPNPHELLSSLSFSWLMETAAAAFDVIIVDAPPLLEYPDAQVIAARAGGALMVTRRHRTTLSDVLEAKRVLEPASAALVGSLIND